MATNYTQTGKTQTARFSSGSGEPPKRTVVGKRRRPTGPNDPQTGERRAPAPTRDDRTPSRGGRGPAPSRDDRGE